MMDVQIHAIDKGKMNDDDEVVITMTRRAAHDLWLFIERARVNHGAVGTVLVDALQRKLNNKLIGAGPNR